MATAIGRKTTVGVPRAARGDDLPVMVWNATTDGSMDFFSHRVYQYSGANPAQLHGTGWLSFVHPEDRPRVVQHWSQAVATGEHCEVACRARQRNGSYRWFLMQATAVAGSAGKPMRWVGTCTEVERDLADKPGVVINGVACLSRDNLLAGLDPNLQLRREEIARVARIALLQETTAAIAHELHQPLTAILSNAQALQTMLKRTGAVGSEVLEALSDIVLEDRRAVAVLRELRTSRSNSADDSSSTDLNALVREVAMLEHDNMVARSCVLDVRLAPRLSKVQVVPAQIQHVLINLLANSCEAMTECPFENRRIAMRTSQPARDRVQVQIEDSGPGIRTNDGNIFKPFYSTKANALGLGLAVCKSIVEAHGGRIAVQDHQADRGATVCIDLGCAPNRLAC